MRGHVRKRGNKWSFAITLGTDPKTGKRKQKTVSGFNTQKEAEKACNEMINQLYKGTYIESTNTTLKDFIAEWLETHAKQMIRLNTYENYSRAVHKRIIPGLGHHQLQKLSPLHVQKFYGDLLDEGLSPKYITYIHAILRKALSLAVRWELVTKNSAELANPPRISREIRATWDLDQTNKFLQSAKVDSIQYYIIYLLALYTGMRRGEILGLRWKDVDLSEGKISVAQNLSYTVNKGLIFQEPKTRSSKRLIAITDIVVEELKKYKAEQSKLRQLFGESYEDLDLVVCNANGKPIHPRNLTTHFNKLVKAVAIPKIRFHDLRHTHATLMLQLGEHPKIVSERLGHSGIEMTMDTYSHVLPNMQKEAAQRFENFMHKKET
ncbi:tyrosine-type recombinase/integrase [Brevibacillus laterosporus]|uniref:tyrosine-type recombinase/integrase n=1 Tax=Brevibacillus laterosporus TaxID=1465 RepID=UPI003D25F15E